jgi:hypothetical protein
VEANLSRVYRKLGISSRRDLRRGWVAETGRGDDPTRSAPEQT